uniref:Glutamate receptor n=2 Tax=Elaeis guineensis var. tenera TaxID=51953 RepID=A0A8N4F3R9_ELAGV|nr:glutamate receptor 2.7 [Elaeis guineensis]
MSWTCMSLAVEDFYAAHPNHTTRLRFHLRNTDQDAISAASAAIDLLKNVQVQAIIGPQTSTQAKFVIELGDKTQVPIISFSARSPALSSQTSYFIRTAWSDSSQAKVIASIVQAFKWREVVPIFEDSDYGNGIVPYLVDAFQEIGAHVPYRSKIPVSATKDKILNELYELKDKQTRVFVVHMTYSLGLQLFSSANEAGMMKEGYVWITTYGLTDIVDLNGSSAISVMKGVLGVKPYVSETKRLRDFKMRWRKKYYQEDPNAKVSEPTTFGLWAYDTVWSLAAAAQGLNSTNYTTQESDVYNSSTDLATLGSSLTGTNLRDRIINSNFSGISGKFHLIDGQLDSSAFEIINVLGHGERRVGFWTPAFNLSGHMDMKADLQSIKWPGGNKAAPKGWEWPTSGKWLRIGVPVKPGFSQFVKLEKDNKTIGRSYCTEVFDAVMKKLPYHVPYKYVAYVDAKGESNGTYDDLVYQVYLENFDAVVGDVTIIANRSLYVDFTLPYTESGVSMLVPIKDKRHKSAWTFLEPLTTDLWLASGAFFVFTGFVVWFLEHRINNEFRGSRARQLGTIFYFSFSTLVFAHREKVASNLSRVVVIIWVFVVLILQQSYTASLTSMLTMQQLEPTVTDLDELIRNGNYVGYLNDSFMPGLLRRLNFNESRIIAYNSPKEYHDAMSNGTVAAIVDEIPYIKVFLSMYCNKYAMVGRTYKTDGFGFVFPKGSPLVADVSRAILDVTENGNMTDIEKILYGDGNCLNQSDTTITSNGLTLNSFWGLFLVTGAATLCALVLHLGGFLYEHRKILRTCDSENSLRQKLALLAKLYDQADPSLHGPKKTGARDEQVINDIVASLHNNSVLRSPSSISNYGHGNFGPEDDMGTPPEEPGTPGREVASHNPDPPSFAEMLNER